jgi:hypothetical protein
MMSRQAYIRASLAVASLELFPARIRGALVSDSAFRHEYGVSADAAVLFGNNIAEFQRSVLFDSVRHLLERPATGITVEDKNRQSWRIEYVADEDLPKVAFVHNSIRFLVVWPAPGFKDTELSVFMGPGLRGSSSLKLCG